MTRIPNRNPQPDLFTSLLRLFVFLFETLFKLLVCLFDQLVYHLYYKHTFDGKIDQAVSQIQIAAESFTDFGHHLRAKIRKIEEATGEIKYIREHTYLIAEKSLLQFRILAKINNLNLKVLTKKEEELLSLKKEKALLDIIASTQDFVKASGPRLRLNDEMIEDLDFLIRYDYQAEVTRLTHSTDFTLATHDLQFTLKESCGFKSLDHLTFHSHSLPALEQELEIDLEEIVLDIEKFEVLNDFNPESAGSLV